jgi:hydroxymethylbilane synthase
MTATATIRVGTRASRLAMAQTEIAISVMAASLPAPIEMVPMTTRGDALSARRPRGGWAQSDGQFTRELERALLAGRLDVVVHSFKDLPTARVTGLRIGAVLERGDPRDCFFTVDGRGIEEMPFGGRVATSSPRRAAQLAAVRSDLVCMPTRGNVESRLQRLDAGEFDAVILAAAGIDRLDLSTRSHVRLPLDVMLPAPAQGALAIQIRADDSELGAHLAEVDHAPTRIAVEAERSLLRAVGGGCLAPLGALAEVNDRTLALQAVLEQSTGELVRAEAVGSLDQAESLVEDIAQRLTALVER